jgi:pimeloyl-ACP methyl ester carboxylesterase
VALTTAALGSCTAAVRTFGSGPPLLLVHGLMTSTYSWRYVLDALGARFTLYMPDLPGNGDSDRALDRSYHPDALADWLGALVRALGIRGAPVIGNSMGGYLSMRLALRDPGVMSRLVNLHSPGVPEARLWALRAALAVPGARRLLARVARRDPERWVHRNVHYWDESRRCRDSSLPLPDASLTWEYRGRGFHAVSPEVRARVLARHVRRLCLQQTRRGER